MKTALWLYVFLFIAFFDLHAQYPILSPFALSLGAAPSFIGFIMGIYSITHLPGNVLAGYGVDRFGSRIFIIFSLIGAGILLLFQSHISNPWQLLMIRSISGFVLAFLSPACLALLAKIAKDRLQQGKLMAGNGLVHTLASVVSPAAGAYLVAKAGFTLAFTVLGWGLIITGFMAIFFIKDVMSVSILVPEAEPSPAWNEAERDSVPLLFFLIPLAISCSQGILFFELSLVHGGGREIMDSGIMFSAVSLGALFTLSLLFLNRFSPGVRTISGCFALALLFFGMAVDWPVPFVVSLLLIGMAKGVIFPAIPSLLMAFTGSDRYGRVFSLMSISYSIGAFLGPIIAGQLRTEFSPYYIAFFILMISITLFPPIWSQKEPLTGKEDL